TVTGGGPTLTIGARVFDLPEPERAWRVLVRVAQCLLRARHPSDLPSFEAIDRCWDYPKAKLLDPEGLERATKEFSGKSSDIAIDAHQVRKWAEELARGWWRDRLARQQAAGGVGHEPVIDSRASRMDASETLSAGDSDKPSL